MEEYKGEEKIDEGENEKGEWKSSVDCNSDQYGALAEESIFVTPKSESAEKFETSGVKFDIKLTKEPIGGNGRVRRRR